uniref:Amine oxidase n=1 Tax=Bos indicus x Bos taurus TaxID=30522 RepID=A0A4W2CGY8_BOBOX
SPRCLQVQLPFYSSILRVPASESREVSISRYQLAVTQRKETEPSSSSVFNQNDTWTPTVDFTDFINNETIAGKDLVAWVTAGFLHIPHAEDIPNMVTVGNSPGMIIKHFQSLPGFDVFCFFILLSLVFCALIAF